MRIRQYIKLLRVKQYIKNGLIFIPIIFNRDFSLPIINKGILGFFAFSFLASAVYILNDLMDLKADRSHPTKKNRPLASGSVPVPNAVFCAGLCTAGSAALCWAAAGVNWVAWALWASYLILNILYSVFFKSLAIIDIVCLSAFYLIRAYFGAGIAGIEISSWLYLTIMSVSFYLGLGKRRNEIAVSGASSRKVLERYSYAFLDKFMYVCVGCSLVFYSLWCKTVADRQSSSGMLVTIPLVIVICMRYSLLVEGDSDGDPTDLVYRDKPILFLIGLYCVITMVTLIV